MIKIYFFLIFLFSYRTNAVIRALNTAATGMATQEIIVNTISNNVANVNTTGYKRQRAESEDLLYETIIKPGARSSNNTVYNVGVQIGSGSKISAVRRQFSQGVPTITNRPYDLMIRGDGLFAVEGPNASRLYTRDGAFNVDSQGAIVTKHGYKLLPEITLPNNILTLAISKNGIVEAYIKDQTEPMNLGQITITTFINPAGLTPIPGNMYEQTSSSGDSIANIAGENNAGDIVQGSLENSNVSIMTEMTDLIKAQRVYEMNSKVMSIADQMLQTINGIR